MSETMPCVYDRAKVDKEAAWAVFDEMRKAREFGIDVDTRRAIFEAQNWRCCYCGVRMFSDLVGAKENPALYAMSQSHSVYREKVFNGRRASIEHVVKQAERADDSRGNLVGACRWCNSSRGDWSASAWFDQVCFLKMVGMHPHFQHNTIEGCVK